MKINKYFFLNFYSILLKQTLKNLKKQIEKQQTNSVRLVVSFIKTLIFTHFIPIIFAKAKKIWCFTVKCIFFVFV